MYTEINNECPHSAKNSNNNDEYDPVEDHLFFNKHLFYAVECSIYKDNHKILDVPKYHEYDFICKLMSIDKESILLVALDSGYILSYHMQNNQIFYKNKTKIYEDNRQLQCNADENNRQLQCNADDLEKDFNYCGVEIENDIVIIDLNIKKEYYKFDTKTGLLRKLIFSGNN